MIELVRRDFDVPVDVESAWDHLAQVERWPSWAVHIRRAQLSPPGSLTAHAKGTFVLAFGMRTTFEMVEYNPPHNWKWVGAFMNLTLYYDHLFESLAGGRSKLTWVIEGEGLGVGMHGRLFALIYNRNLDRAIPGLIDELAGLAHGIAEPG